MKFLLLTTVAIFVAAGLSLSQLQTFDYLKVKADSRPSDYVYLDRNGAFLYQKRIHYQYRQFSWLSLERWPKSHTNLLLKAEDRRFFYHVGVDVFSLLGAAYDSLVLGKNRGGSTLTMQLVRILESSSTRKRTLHSKLKEIVKAIRLEMNWTKQEILEAYLNLVPIKGELRGFETASQILFGKSGFALTPSEMATLVVLLREPQASEAKVAHRACRLLEQSECGIISLKSSMIYSPEVSIPKMPKEAIVQQLEWGRYKTSIDLRIQKIIEQAVSNQLQILKSQRVSDAAVIVFDLRENQIVGLVQNGGRWSSAPHVDLTRARRQAGSILKPFLYGLVFENGYAQPLSKVNDEPLEITLENGSIYQPKNYDFIFRGPVTLAESLAGSLNVPAVRMLQLIGFERYYQFLGKLGLKIREPVDFFGASLALGAVDITLWDLVFSYRNLASPHVHFSSKTRGWIWQILSQNKYRASVFGHSSVLDLSRPVAVKTGTSKDMRDNWCVGWNGRYIVGVWVGNANGEPMWAVSGLVGAAPIWREVISQLPTTLVQVPEPFETIDLIGQHDFIAKRSRILKPAHRSWFAYDPDIPLRQQKLEISIENGRTPTRVFVNGQEITEKLGDTYFTELKRGRHVIQLKSASGEVLDRSVVQVK